MGHKVKVKPVDTGTEPIETTPANFAFAPCCTCDSRELIFAGGGNYVVTCDHCGFFGDYNDKF